MRKFFEQYLIFFVKSSTAHYLKYKGMFQANQKVKIKEESKPKLNLKRFPNRINLPLTRY